MIGVPSHGLGKHFDGDAAIQLGIARPIHLAHPPSTDRGKDFVGTECECLMKAALDYLVGARCFSSSNQFNTTWICGAVVTACPDAGATPMNLPSGRMS
jgi:hypothetical protein